MFINIDIYEELETNINLLLTNINISNPQLTNIKKLINNDNEVQVLKHYGLNVWPNHTYVLLIEIRI